MRSVFGFGIMVVHLNLNIKKEVWDGIDWRNANPLIYKTIVGVILNTLAYSMTKYITPTIISIATNLTPIFVVLLCVLIIKEKVDCVDISMILLTLVGITLVCIG